MSTPLGDAVQFFKDFGLFDVVLPFLLVFTLVFALLEKTKILGTEGKDGPPKRSLNTMVAFVVGLLVIATNKVVNIINAALPNIVLMIVAVVMFLVLVGTFYKDGTFNFAETHSGWVIGLTIAFFVLILIILANSITTESGETWLEYAISGIFGSGGTTIGATAGAAIVFLVIAAAAIFVVVKKPKGSGK